MSAFETFVTIEKKIYRLELPALTLEALKQQIIEVSKTDQEGKVLNIITNENDSDVETDQQIQQAAKIGRMRFHATFQTKIKDFPKKVRLNKKKEQEPLPSVFELKNPLVLLTGVIHYIDGPYIEEAKQDLLLLQSLFQTKLGYQVFNSYNSQNPATEILTVKQLNKFLFKYCAYSSEKSKSKKNKEAHDGVIFVWCGHGGLESYDETVITGENISKEFKEIKYKMDLTDSFIRKPKIYIKIVYIDPKESDLTEIKEENENNQLKISFKQNADVFTIFANVPRKQKIIDDSGIEKTAMHFTDVLCQAIENSSNKNLTSIVQTTITTLGQVFEKEIRSTNSAICPEVYLIPKSFNIDTTVQTAKEKEVTDALDLRKHWNTYWRKANLSAAQKVQQMLQDDEQGLVIVATYHDERTYADKDFCSSFALMGYGIIKKERFSSYWLYAIKSKLILLDRVNIDGNIYVVNCEIRCKDNVNITTQIFVTANAVVDPRLNTCLSPIIWNSKIHHDVPLQLQTIEDNIDFYDTIKEIAHARKYLQLSITTFGRNHPYIAIAYHFFALIYDHNQRPEQAIEYYEKALQTFFDSSNITCPFVADLYKNLANTYVEIDQKIKCYEKALELQLKIFGSNSAEVASTYNDIGNTYSKVNKAIEYYEMALKITRKLFGNMSTFVGNTCWSLGDEFEKRKEMNIAKQYFTEAWKAYSASLGEWDNETQQAKSRLGK
ncbi:hypothetical protein RFI_19040 [Reticulomyxa filosa]|uniref:Uncharacterized protein n=1 Tax=Reticulomyxa filosa TaxID=46433 RepID=X6MXM7_RETFI|nr:hypothetical protein RFI_19040 [Reticulomyxa filosa]|eukprot:ETO18242.1 hypothetical protein RFI_19040 [Reticulomyxa filosa]